MQQDTTIKKALRITLWLLGIIFFPFAIGYLLSKLAYKHIPNQKLKYATIALVALPSLTIGSAWASGLVDVFSGTSSPTPPKEVTQVQHIAHTPTLTPEEEQQNDMMVEELLEVEHSPEIAGITDTTNTEDSIGVLSSPLADVETSEAKTEVETSAVIPSVQVSTPTTPPSVPQTTAKAPPTSTGSSSSSTQADTQPVGECNIKGNISSDGEKIYHVPGCQSYKRTKIDPALGERMFCSEAEAKAAGWRKALNCS